MKPNMAPEGGNNYSNQVSLSTLGQLLSIRGEGDEWEFKETLGSADDPGARVNVAKDALALCNLTSGGTIVVGVTKDYNRVGLHPNAHIDTSVIRKAVEKYIDGEFSVLAAEHELLLNGQAQPR